jgi:hypothetical protein
MFHGAMYLTIKIYGATHHKRENFGKCDNLFHDKIKMVRQHRKKREKKKEKEKTKEEKNKDGKYLKKGLELKMCFGNNKSRLTLNQMKFKGYVRNVEGYKSVSEDHWKILLQFYGKCKLVVFEEQVRA